MSYDDLAPDYHLIFEDWEASMARQGAALSAILQRECGPASAVRVLDCACGIGTQALPLAKLGFHVTGSDISPAAIERARREAALRGLHLPLSVAAMQNPGQTERFQFNAVICMDNALPHLESDEQLAQAAAQIRQKLRPAGLFMASIRDYDLLIVEKPTVQGPSFHSDQGQRRLVFQVWDWLDDRCYVFHLYITRETPEGWRTLHCAATYRAVLRKELTSILEESGFRNVRWLFPKESSFYQPIVLAQAPGSPA